MQFQRDELRMTISSYIEQDLEGVSLNGINEDFSTSTYRSFYGSSKLACELLIQEYAQFKGLKATINRSGVISGPGQFGKVDQGVLVHWLTSFLWKKDLAYFGYGGTGKQVRDSLHFDDLMSLIDKEIQNQDKFH